MSSLTTGIERFPLILAKNFLISIFLSLISELGLMSYLNEILGVSHFCGCVPWRIKEDQRNKLPASDVKTFF